MSRTPSTHCAHRWANNEDPQKSGKTGNMRFEGMAIYSYSTVIAVKYPKKRTVLMAGEGIRNSLSTVGHKGRVRAALSGAWKIVEVDCTIGDGCELRTVNRVRICHDGMKKTLAKKLAAVAVSRKGVSLGCRYQEYAYYLKKCNAVAEFLGRKPEVPYGLDEASLEEIRKAVERNRLADEAKKARDAKRREKEQAERAAQTAVNMEKWRSREYTGDTWDFPHIILRVSKCGKFIETSQSAVVPLADAQMLFRMCRHCRERNEGLAVADMQVGGYSLRSITNEGDATVGCHFLMFSEMERCFEDASKRGLI